MIRDLLVKIHVPPHIVYIHLLINLTLLVGVPVQGVRAHPLPSSLTSFNNGTSSEGGGGGEGGGIGSEGKGFTHERLKKQKSITVNMNACTQMLDKYTLIAIIMQ